MRQLQKKIKTGMLDLKQDDPFELFIAATNIRYCYYNETHKILGNTFGMCVLQVGCSRCESLLHACLLAWLHFLAAAFPEQSIKKIWVLMFIKYKSAIISFYH